MGADTQRHALIDHIISGHGADDRINTPWPTLETLKREHNAAHDHLPNSRGTKYDVPDHGHDGTDAWRGPATLRVVA